ncbi:MAG: nucleoside-diphosphate sugar epimerase/dehydratase [Clostridia bacterium]
MKIKKYIYMILDIPVIVFSLFFAAALRFDFQIPTHYYEYILNMMPVSIISVTVFGVCFGAYNNILKYFGFSEIFKQLIVSMCMGMVLIVSKFTGLMEVSGSITVMFCGIFFAFSSTIRGVPRFQRYMLSVKGLKEGKNKKVLIIGGGEAGALVTRQFIDANEGLFPVGILDDDEKKHGRKIAGVKVLGSIDKTAYYAKVLNVKQVVIAMPSATETQLSKIFDLISSANVKIKLFQTALDIDNKKTLKEITIEDLLFRNTVKVDSEINKSFIEKKTVLVTGGVGSIGSELCRQILDNNCEHLIIYDINENGLFDINEEFKTKFKDKYTLCLGCVKDTTQLDIIFDTYKPQIVFHAAAHKHVPMMEINPFEAVKNNVFGTLNVIQKSIENECDKFILISTDKAVNPTNVMGATKRICELLVKAYSNQNTEMVAVRFGNVLGSNGSVIPLFKKQIAAGGPVTITHKDMTRYFMTIPEAVSLVLSAGASAKGSELFVLDMGQPVKIYDLAINLIRLSGLRPFQDINIKEIGIRPGEKMFEELNLSSEVVDKTSHNKIFVMRDDGVDKNEVVISINKLARLVQEQNNEKELREVLFDLIKEKEMV